jgi:hypothetical protein
MNNTFNNGSIAQILLDLAEGNGKPFSQYESTSWYE